MIKGVIFDLDNTLVDFMRMKKLSCEEAMTAMIDAGLNVPKKKGLQILFELYDKYGIESKLIFQHFLKKTIGYIDWKILANGVVAYRRIKTGYLIPYPHVKSTLLSLKTQKIKLAIVSDAPRMRGWLRLAALHLTHFFDIVVTHDDTGRYKPHKKPFLVALKKMQLKPEEVLMVGDWPERDIKGANKLGMNTCFARYGYHQKKRIKRSEADFEIKSFKEILKVIKKIK